MLYEYCERNHVSHRRIGKLVVATSNDEIEILKNISQRARANGVDDIQMITQSEVKSLEPHLSCVAGLLSPSSGIVDGHGLMLALLGDAECHGAVVAYRSKVSEILPCRYGFVTAVNSYSSSVTSRFVINAAGLSASEVAGTVNGLQSSRIPRTYYAKGSYFSLSGKAPFSRLVYPVPAAGGLGIHYTVDLGGRARFGPDVQWVDEIEYSVDPARADLFSNEIRKYWKGVSTSDLNPDYAGVRPKLAPSGSADSDFVVQTASEHGIRGLVNLFGIESPGLTASLALSDFLVRVVTSSSTYKHPQT
jgi:L-2-hydroxyglutarate oxidase LhgO